MAVATLLTVKMGSDQQRNLQQTPKGKVVGLHRVFQRHDGKAFQMDIQGQAFSRINGENIYAELY
jgi:hypothetical protein